MHQNPCGRDVGDGEPRRSLSDVDLSLPVSGMRRMQAATRSARRCAASTVDTAASTSSIASGPSTSALVMSSIST